MPTGVKYDNGKSPVVQGFLHYFPRAIKAAAEVSRYGKEKYAVKYEDAGWRSVEDGQNRYTDGDGRHLVDEAIDGLYDPESELLHAAHHLWNAAARLELMLRDGVPLKNPKGGFGRSASEKPEVQAAQKFLNETIKRSLEFAPLPMPGCGCIDCEHARGPELPQD